MPRLFASLLILLAAAGLVHAGEPQGKLIHDWWDAAFLEGGRAGFIHTTVHEFQRDGQKVLRTTVDLHLTLKRNKETIKLRGTTGNDETAAGKVLSTYMRQQVGQDKVLTITGVVKGKMLDLLLDGKTGVLKSAPWDERAVGMFRQQTMFQDKKVKPGDKFTYMSFEPSVNLVLRTDVSVKDYEDVTLMGGKTKKRLLRVEFAPEKLENVPLPVLTQWLNDDGKPQRQQVEIPGLGMMTLYRTTQELALAPGTGVVAPDIGISQLIRVNKKLLQPYELSKITYRISVKGEEDASQTFVRDARQQVKQTMGDTFVLEVSAKRGLTKTAPAAKIADEFIQSSYFITSADAKVKELARKAVGKEKDPLRKALLIEQWVNMNMRGTSMEALAPADQVARNLEGDCTEYAMLMAAMCRAEGVPSRTAIGLIYVDGASGPFMGFHMWTEVWVQDQWLGLDATLGRGYVGPTHLKITDHSWQDTRNLTPLLPLIRVLGKVQIEIVSAQ